MTEGNAATAPPSRRQEYRQEYRQERRQERWRKWRGEALQLALVALVVLAARSSLADHYVIPSSSMEYTLLPGDHVFVDKLAYGLRVPFTDWRLSAGDAPARGEVVIFDSPEDGTRLIKRVVAVAGDVVSIVDGELMIDGRSARASGWRPIEVVGGHVADLNLSFGGGVDLAPTAIAEGTVLVVGDARGNSRDGRFFGAVDADSIYGKADGVIYRRGEGLVWRPL